MTYCPAEPALITCAQQGAGMKGRKRERETEREKREMGEERRIKVPKGNAQKESDDVWMS